MLSAGPTPRVPLEKWDLRVDGHVAHPQRWTWEQFLALPREKPRVDIHCVTKWSKFDTGWKGVRVRDLLERECTPTHVRAAWSNDTGRIPGLWDRLEEMGVPALLVPEADGGVGLTMADLVLVLEETGRYAVPEPILETAAFGAPVVGAGVTVAAGHALVPWADSADVILTSAGRFDPATAELVARPSVDGARRVFEVRGEPAPFPGDLHAAYGERQRVRRRRGDGVLDDGRDLRLRGRQRREAARGIELDLGRHHPGQSGQVFRSTKVG